MNLSSAEKKSQDKWLRGLVQAMEQASEGSSMINPDVREGLLQQLRTGCGAKARRVPENA